MSFIFSQTFVGVNQKIYFDRWISNVYVNVKTYLEKRYHCKVKNRSKKCRVLFEWPLPAKNHSNLKERERGEFLTSALAGKTMQRK